MNVTRVVFYSKDRNKKALAACSVVLDDELRINDILLFKNDRDGGGYFLVLPSRQDVYQEIQKLNEGTEISFPKNSLDGTTSKKKYEEFYHPVKGSLYKSILNAIVEAFEKSQ